MIKKSNFFSTTLIKEKKIWFTILWIGKPGGKIYFSLGLGHCVLAAMSYGLSSKLTIQGYKCSTCSKTNTYNFYNHSIKKEGSNHNCLLLVPQSLFLEKTCVFVSLDETGIKMGVRNSGFCWHFVTHNVHILSLINIAQII